MNFGARNDYVWFDMASGPSRFLVASCKMLVPTRLLGWVPGIARSSGTSGSTCASARERSGLVLGTLAMADSVQ